MTCIITSFNYAIIFILAFATTPIISDDKVPIPANKLGVNKWFIDNVKPLEGRKGTLDALLVEAEATPQTIKVRKDGSGNFKMVMQAINSIPSGNKKRVKIDIGEGVYHEQILINRTKPFVTLFGTPGTRPTLQFNSNTLKAGTAESSSLTVDSDYFVAYNLIIKNSSPKPTPTTVGAQGAALKLGGDKAAIYNCDILGHQDTLLDNRGRHFYFGCYVTGTMDFIFGSGKSLFVRTRIHAIDRQGITIITAQARATKFEDSGFSFVHSQITGDLKDNTLLGRYWKNVPSVLFAYSTWSDVIKPVGWENTKSLN